MDVSLLGALAAGLISFLSPCVLPLVPPYLAYRAGSGVAALAAGDDAALRRRVFVRALAFVAGFSTVFVALGATATLIGQAMAQALDTLAIVAGLAIIAMGLHFLGLFRFAFLDREARIEVEGNSRGLLAAYGMGLAFAFGWTPCVGPVLAAILVLAGSGDSVGRGAGLLAAYSLGIGLPFLATALLAGPMLRLLNRLKASLGLVTKITGALLVATGLLILTGGMPAIAFWLLETFPVLGRLG